MMKTLLIATFLLLVWSDARGAEPPEHPPFDHLLVIYLENHSFDNLYGLFPGANGLGRPGAAIRQVDRDGVPYARLPQPVASYPWPPTPDRRFPKELPNAPFLIDRYVPLGQIVPMPVHRFYQHQLQNDGGRMDKYIAWSDSGALTMGYFDTTKLPLYPYARQYTLADNYFTAAFGGSWNNHIWLVCSCNPVFPNAPKNILADPEFDATGKLVGLKTDGDVSPDGYAVNHLPPFYPPNDEGSPADRVPPQTQPTIGDRLSAAGVSWAWYAEGWNAAVAGNPPPGFTPHHQPFVYFEGYKPGTAARAEHLKDETDLRRSLADGTLPAVSFFKPLNIYTDNPGEGSMLVSERRIVTLIEAVKKSSVWPRTAIFVTYDDFGGWFDHVSPHPVDRFGPGGRVPLIVISPQAKKRYVDSTLYDTTSILKLIEWRWALPSLTARDAAAANMVNAFAAPKPPATTAPARSAPRPARGRRATLGPT